MFIVNWEVGRFGLKLRDASCDYRSDFAIKFNDLVEAEEKTGYQKKNWWKAKVFTIYRITGPLAQFKWPEAGEYVA